MLGPMMRAVVGLAAVAVLGSWPAGQVVAKPAAPVPAQAPWIGVGITDGAAGVAVTEVYHDTPAADAGLAPGDEILEVNGTGVTTTRALISQITRREPGDKVPLLVLRDGKRFVARVVLARKPTAGELMESQLVGRPAPPVPGVGRSGGFEPAAYRGRAVVLLLFSFTSPTGDVAVRALAKQSHARSDREAVIVGAVPVVDGGQAAVRAFANRMAVSFALLPVDAMEVSRAYAWTHGLPAIIVLDRGGIVRFARTLDTGTGDQRRQVGALVDEATYALEGVLASRRASR